MHEGGLATSVIHHRAFVVARGDEGARGGVSTRSEGRKSKANVPVVSLTEGNQIPPRTLVRSESAVEKLGIRRCAGPIRFAVCVVEKDTL